MFGEEILLGDTERSIALETRKGRNIRNVVAPEPDEQAHQKYEAVRERFGQTWTNRKGPCGGYNCYGMVFATRRTAIYEDDQIPDILKDDGYRQISAKEVRPGDIVLYRDRTLGLLHAALVLRCQEWEGPTPVPFALSKWSGICGEDEHNVRHHIWPVPEYDVDIEFWTERRAT
jgi:hypothetical protein